MTIILSSQFGGILYGIAMGTQADGRFVGRPDILNPYPRPDGETDEILFEGSAVIPEDFLAVQQQFKAEHDALQGKRYVFIPINDGYKSLVEGRIWIEDKEALSVGNHWSFIVVDTLMKTARYIDSLVPVCQGASGRDMIENTQINSEVAGMVLYGFNTFMGYPKGAFTSSTLKWLPNGNLNNSGRFDAGSCGLYVYAIMKYFLSNCELLLKGLKESFTRARRPAYVAEIGFNSRHTRKEIQGMIWSFRQTKDAANPTVHPVGLTIGPTGNLLVVLDIKVLQAEKAPDFLRTLLMNLDRQELEAMLNPRVLKAVLTPNILRSVLVAHEKITNEHYKDDQREYRGLPDDDNHDDEENYSDDDSEDDNMFRDDIQTSVNLQKVIDDLKMLDRLNPEELGRLTSLLERTKELPTGATTKDIAERSTSRTASLHLLAARMASLAKHRRNNVEQLRARLKFFRDTEANTPRQRRRELHALQM
jgi:hypothetical protein